MRTAFGAAIALAASAAACALVTDLGDLRADASAGDAEPGDALPDVPLPSSCSGAYACAIAAPTGWSGPFALYDGNPNNAPSSCPTLAAVNVVTGYVDVDGGAATCSACTSCTVGFTAAVQMSNNGCQSLTCDAGVASANTCVDLTVCAHDTSLAISSPSFSCTTTGPAPTIPPVAFDEEGVGCAAQQIVPIDCAAGNVCVPTPSPPFDPQLCVGMAGDVTCPGAPYSVKHVFQTKVDDTRGCSACGCTLHDAGVTWTAYISPTCGGVPLGVGTSGCAIVTNFKAIRGTTTGSCAVTGPGSPTGGVTGATPYTVCCQP